MNDDKCPLLYTDNIEAIPVDEADDIAGIVQAMQFLLARHQAKSGEFVADVHVKPHGYAKREFRVLPNLPQELAQRSLWRRAPGWPLRSHTRAAVRMGAGLGAQQAHDALCERDADHSTARQPGATQHRVVGQHA